MTAGDLAIASELRECARMARHLESKLQSAGQAALAAKQGALAQGIELKLSRAGL